MTKPLKSFASIDEQIDVLSARGLTLERDIAKQWLQSVGYYRLSGYWYPYREMGGQEHRLDSFIADASFDEVARLYEFDRKLRTLIHDGIERVEVALRSHISYHLGSLGPIEYQDPAIFRPSFNHAGWIATARVRAARARRHSEPIRHHEARYDGTLPIWVLTEVLDFSDVSRLYDGLFAKDQWAIAKGLGLIVNDDNLSPNQRAKARKSHPLARWLEQLTVVRNTCAHHSRVWNKSFTPVSTAAVRTIGELRSLPLGQSERLYGALLVIGYFLQEISPGSTWMSKVRNLIEGSFAAMPGRIESEMGFPELWREEQLWALPTPDARA
ncbi:Abi family protein [Leucobacter sp. HY1908]